MERAGIDIVSDGEVRRESYFNRFANSLDGLDVDNPGEMLGRDDKMKIVPRVVGEIKRHQAGAGSRCRGAAQASPTSRSRSLFPAPSP